MLLKMLVTGARLLDRSVARSVDGAMARLLAHSIARSFDRSVPFFARSLGRSVAWWFGPCRKIFIAPTASYLCCVCGTSLRWRTITRGLGDAWSKDQSKLIAWMWMRCLRYRQSVGQLYKETKRCHPILMHERCHSALTKRAYAIRRVMLLNNLANHGKEKQMLGTCFNATSI